MGMLGPKATYDYEHREDPLGDWVSESGRGVMGFNFGDIPDDCLNFCLEQFHRFRVPCPEEIVEVVIAGASASFFYADVWDPYCLFSGVSDVNITDDWALYAYERWDPYFKNKKPWEIEANTLETFAFVPGQAEEVFNYIMSHPGLEAIPFHIGRNIDDILRGDHNGEEMWDSITSDTEKALQKICTDKNGDVSKAQMEAYFQLAAWAGFAWLAGPPGRPYRRARHMVIDTAIEFGEAIVTEGTVSSPEYFRKLNRPPSSCLHCGLNAWCVELTVHEGGTRFICESCSSAGMPNFGTATCGTRICLLTACPNHPNHSEGAAGIAHYARTRGQLTTASRGESILINLQPKSRTSLKSS